MKIGIDARLLERNMTGIGRYLENVVKNIYSFDKKNEYVLFTYKKFPKFKETNVQNVSTMDIGASSMVTKIKSALWLHLVLPFFLKKEKIDIFFSPNTLLPFFKTTKKNVVTVHDVFHLVNPKFHSFFYRVYVSLFLSRSVKSADLVFTVSNASKKDIVNFLKIKEEKIVVAYLAADSRFIPRSLSLEDRHFYTEKYKLPDRFVLYLGVLEERKNIEGIIKIADELLGKTDIPIVLAGKVGHGGEKYLKEIEKRKNIFYCGFFDDVDLPYIYNIADIFLFPSYYEGFGLPPLEAMKSGVPVITSNTSSLPEVVGEGGILLDPNDHKSFVKAIMLLQFNPRERTRLIEEGIKQAEKFDFMRTARMTIEALNSLCYNHPHDAE